MDFYGGLKCGWIVCLTISAMFETANKSEFLGIWERGLLLSRLINNFVNFGE